MMGINALHLLELVIRPTLQSLGTRYATVAAQRLVLGTAACESELTALRQIVGPALGLWQMEPATHESLWLDLLLQRPSLRSPIEALIGDRPWKLAPDGHTYYPDPIELVGNLFYGAAMCRVRYLWDSHPLPGKDDVQGMAETWKRAYNTVAGAGTVERFIREYERLVLPILG